MKADDLAKKCLDKRDKLDHIIIPNYNAWLDENYEKPAMVGRDSVFLDIKDNKIRKEVYLRSVFKYIQDKKWHTDIIKSINDLNTKSKKCKAFTIPLGDGMFPDYCCFLMKDKETYEKIMSEYDNDIKTLWKTDDEYFQSCVEYILSRIEFDNFYYFVEIFNNNEFGIKFEDIENNPTMKEFFMNIIFNILKETSKNKYEND